ncbi:flagellar protein FliT [Mixta intestinalis]|uniref:Flagellar protein FliT n=1 Tax=Mixta intestinalis TaxID=1615494 RepID=A0A6P1Q2K7_9GAMM|nr:flagellar protein FliT [Mixta intestinalis]QHM73220.1 Flagellar protein FliT [Mixta intestinalis]
MSKPLNKDYNTLYEMNQAMLVMARQGQWDDFVTLAQDYIVNLGAVLEQVPETLSADEKAQLGTLLTSLQNNEAEISRALEARLDVLKKGISSLHNGKKCSQAYTSQIISPFQ